MCSIRFLFLLLNCVQFLNGDASQDDCMMAADLEKGVLKLTNKMLKAQSIENANDVQLSGVFKQRWNGLFCSSSCRTNRVNEGQEAAAVDNIVKGIVKKIPTNLRLSQENENELKRNVKDMEQTFCIREYVKNKSPTEMDEENEVVKSIIDEKIDKGTISSFKIFTSVVDNGDEKKEIEETLKQAGENQKQLAEKVNEVTVEKIVIQSGGDKTGVSGATGIEGTQTVVTQGSEVNQGTKVTVGAQTVVVPGGGGTKPTVIETEEPIVQTGGNTKPAGSKESGSEEVVGGIILPDNQKNKEAGGNGKVIMIKDPVIPYENTIIKYKSKAAIENVKESTEKLSNLIKKFKQSDEIKNLIKLVEVAKWVKSTGDLGLKAVVDDKGATQIIQGIIDKHETYIREYLIRIFKTPTEDTRKLIYYIYYVDNLKTTGEIVDLISRFDADSTEPGDNKPGKKKPEIFDSKKIVFCQEVKLGGEACHVVDVEKCVDNGVIPMNSGQQKIEFKSFFIPPGMYIRIKFDKVGKSNMRGLKGPGVWSSRSAFDGVKEVDVLTKQQYQSIEKDNDEIKDGEDRVGITAEVVGDGNDEKVVPVKNNESKEDLSGKNPYGPQIQPTPLDEFAPSAQNKIGQIDSIEPSYTISFWVKPKSKNGEKNSGILTFKRKNVRIIKVLVLPDSTKLVICSFPFIGSKCIKTDDLEIGKYSLVILTQKREPGTNNYGLTVEIEGKMYSEKATSKNVVTSSDVEVYSVEHKSPADVMIRDLRVNKLAYIEGKFRKEYGGDVIEIEKTGDENSVEKEEEFTLKKNNLIATIPKILKSWMLSFDIKPLGKVEKWNSIIHMSANDNNCCKDGDRIPGIWFYPKSLSLLVCNTVDGNGNRCVKISEELKMNEYTHVSIEQEKTDDGVYITRVFIKGKMIDTKNKFIHKQEPREYVNVKMYASDPWHNPANAQIRFLEFKNIDPNNKQPRPQVSPQSQQPQVSPQSQQPQVSPQSQQPQVSPQGSTTQFKPLKNNIIKTIDKINTEWELSVKIRPVAKKAQLTNILQLTDKNNYYTLRVNFFEDSTELSICALGLSCVHYLPALPIGKYTSLKIKQVSDGWGRFALVVIGDGNTPKRARLEARAKVQKEVNFYASMRNMEPANVELKDMVFDSGYTIYKYHDGELFDDGPKPFYSDFKPYKNNIIKTIDKIATIWELSFDIKPEGKKAGQLTNILQLTDKNNYYTLRVNFYQDSTELSICAQGTCVSTPALPIGKYTSLKIKQVKESGKYALVVIVDGKDYKQVFEQDPKEQNEVNFYASMRNMEPANVILRRLVFDSGYIRYIYQDFELFEEGNPILEDYKHWKQPAFSDVGEEPPFELEDESSLGPERWSSFLYNRYICLTNAIQGSQIKDLKTVKLHIPKNVKVELQNECGSSPKQGSFEPLVYDGPITLDFSKGLLSNYKKVVLLNKPKEITPIPDVNDESEEEKKEKEQQEKEENDSKQKDVKTATNVPSDRGEMIKACDDQDQCVYAKRPNLLYKKIEAIGLNIEFVYIPAGTYMPTVELPKQKPGQPMCYFSRSIMGPAKVTIARFKKLISGNPKLRCKLESEKEYESDDYEEAVRKSFVARRSSFFHKFKYNQRNALHH